MSFEKLNTAFRKEGKFYLKITDQTGHVTEDTSYFPEVLKESTENNTTFFEDKDCIGFIVEGKNRYEFKYLFVY